MTRLEVWMRPNTDIGRKQVEQRWYRKGVWEDGEVVEGSLNITGREDADAIRESYDGRNSVVVSPVDRGEFLQGRVDRDIVTREDVRTATLGGDDDE